MEPIFEDTYFILDLPRSARIHLGNDPCVPVRTVLMSSFVPVEKFKERRDLYNAINYLFLFDEEINPNEGIPYDKDLLFES